MRNLVSGVFILGVGYFNGGSVFWGHPTTVDYIFDAMGAGFVLYGIYQLITGRSRVA
jgi:predicted phage tail protein